MPLPIRLARPTALALVGLLALTACTGITPVKSAVKTSDPDAALTVIDAENDRDASVATSRELFDASPVVVIAPTGDPNTQELAARTAIGLGVPLLIGDAGKGSTSDEATVPEAEPESHPTAALVSELKRLGTTTVLAIGNVAPMPEGVEPDLTVKHVKATAKAVSEATGLDLGTAATEDPAGFAAGLAAQEVAAVRSSASPSAAIRRPERATPLKDTVALAVDNTAHLGSIATARAAGVPVRLLPAASANPQAHASVVEALHASTATRTLALGAEFAAQPALDWKIRTARSGTQLPGGGQLLFPQHQFVALYGTPSTGVLGVLGEQNAAATVQRARDVAAPFEALTEKTVVPMFEIIATVAAAGAGKDGNFSNELPVDELRPFVDAAAAAGMYVVLDLQPGRTDFLTQAKLYQPLLELPNVGLALDPEWRLGADQVPLRQIGSVSASEVNTVTTWLADLTNEKGLPQKMFVLHQFRPAMVSDRLSLDLSRPEIAVLIHADGQGGQGDKQATWANLHRDAPAGVHWGWKNFYDEDLPVLTPEQTMRAVSPAPDLITYQ
ncbi:hypothetical protein [Mycetocola sp.]|uniref:hypothetical protein n=1 Tax=Mycetocola sp. TaxID=1871042 RepID=UPI0026205051|nr:hypothetical protein [Mycetocola sp.]MCU1560551.1 hypothetical protein [Mycetocola sp.]